MLVLWLALAFRFIILLLLLLPLNAFISFENKKTSISVKFAFIPINIGGGKSKKSRIPKKENEGNKKQEKSEAAIYGAVRLLNAFYSSSKQIRRTVKIEKLNLSAVYGSGDAAATGFIIGIFYAEIYKLIGFFSSIFTVDPPSITVKPSYADEPAFEYSGSVKIKSTLFNLILSGMIFYLNYKSYK